MAMRRLYAMLSSECGWSLEYIDEMPFERAIWQMENLDHLGNEKARIGLAIAASVMADKRGWEQISRAFPEPWRRPRRVRVRRSHDGKKRGE